VPPSAAPSSRAAGPRAPASEEGAGARLAVVGKGGAGKSVIAGTAARVLARRGHRVLTLDSDYMPGLAFSMGARPPATPSLEGAANTEDRRGGLRKGIGPVRAVQRYSTEGPDGIRLIEAGKSTPEGLPAILPALKAFYDFVHRLPKASSLRGWTIVGDLPAGPRQAAFDWVPYADILLLVVQPTSQYALTARRIARIARSRPGVTVLPVANRVAGTDDVRHIEELLGEPVFASIPADGAVAEAERLGVAPIDHDPSCPAVLAIEGVVESLLQGRPAGAGDHGGRALVG